MQQKLRELAANWRVVTVTGPRQSGKTTLVQLTFPDKPYANLESPETRAFALEDPKEFLSQFPNGAVLDEIQRAPELLSYIQVIVDEQKRDGMFILTGSHQLQLHEAISQSLAGRTALLTLLPMSLGELEDAGIELTLNEALFTGGYPRLFERHLNPTEIYRNYFQTYIERDLRQLIRVKDLSLFQKFMQLCAGRVGQVLNLDSLAGDVGVSSSTIKQWLSILEASYIITRLQPYYENLGRRAIKSPKLFFTDVGFACYLLRIKSATQVARDPLRGHLVENLVMLEVLKAHYNRGEDAPLYYFRDVHQHEVDLIYQSGHELIPIEVKAASTFNSDLLKGLRFFRKLTPERCHNGYLVYSGTHEQSVDGFRIVNYRNIARTISARHEI